MSMGQPLNYPVPPTLPAANAANQCDKYNLIQFIYCSNCANNYMNLYPIAKKLISR